MYGLQTINHINRRNDEAAEITQRHAIADKQHAAAEDSGELGVGGSVAHRAEAVERVTKANETRERILAGARG